LSTRRVLFGQRNAGEYGAWVTKQGKDVFSTVDDDFLLGSNTYPLLPIFTGSVATLPLLSDSNVVIFDSDRSQHTVEYGLLINHSLGYVPMCWTDLNPAATASNLSGTDYPQISLPGNVNVTFIANATYAGLYLKSTQCFVYYSTRYGGSGDPYQNPISQVYLKPLSGAIGSIKYAITQAQIA